MLGIIFDKEPLSINKVIKMCKISLELTKDLNFFNEDHFLNIE